LLSVANALNKLATIGNRADRRKHCSWILFDSL